MPAWSVKGVKLRGFLYKLRLLILSLMLPLMLLLILTVAFSMVLIFPCFADSINLDIRYGYQNTAKAGRFLPLKIKIENTMDRTFSGLIHVYMAASEEAIYEYRYKQTVEAESESELEVAVSLGTGVNQIYVTAESIGGELMGARRIGLDVTGSDAELIIGILSNNGGSLSYLNGISVNDGLLRTRTVNLDPNDFPSDETEFDQLDILLVTNFSLSDITKSEISAMEHWIEKGGVLLIGTGAKGGEALKPYYESLLARSLDPMLMSVSLGREFGNGEPGSYSIPLTASAVYLRDGNEIFLSDVIPILSSVKRGMGLIAVCGYDFCDIQRFATEHPQYVDKLLSGILGTGRLRNLSVSASERSLNQYWDIQELMNISNVSKLPPAWAYTLILLFYILLIGPGIYFYMRRHDTLSLYRPAVIIMSAVSVLIIWVLGISTRFNAPFLTYARLRDVSKESIDETDFINLRSPYGSSYSLDVKTEYFVYPVIRGSDYSGDIAEKITNDNLSRTCIEYDRSHTNISVRNEAPFAAKYFELDNRIPNAGGHFSGNVFYYDGRLSGTVSNGTEDTLYDAVLLIYGELVHIGRLENGQTVDLTTLERETVPVGNNNWIASRISNGPVNNFLYYYLSENLGGYFQDACLIGFVRDESLGFITDGDASKLESYGITMVVSTIPIDRTKGGSYEYNALMREPDVGTGEYDAMTNTVSGSVPTVLSYHLGEDVNISWLSFSHLYLDEGKEDDPYASHPFRGSIGFFNIETGVYDIVDFRDGKLSGEELAPYLDDNNVLTLRFVSEKETAEPFSRWYLPMITVNASRRRYTVD